MQRRYIRGLFATGALFAFTAFYFALPAFARAESISAFDAHLAIQKDGTVAVTEQIIYDFGSEQRHGIYRTIPLTAENGPRITIGNISVTDAQGNAYPFSVSTSGGDENIKIGDPNATVTGRKTYMISYTVGNVIRGFTDHEELYWNVTGNGWQVPIGHAEATVALPSASSTDVNVRCFTGPQGSTQQNCTADMVGGAAQFATTRSLGSGEGLSIVVGMPLGSVTSVATSTGTTVAESGGAGSSPEGMAIPFVFLSGIFIAVAFAVTARAFGRSRSVRRATRPIIPKELKERSIIAEYEAPDSLPPIEVGTITDREVDPADISSVIIDLAVRGYLKVRYVKSKVLLFTRQDFELVKLKEGTDLATPADREVFAMFFSNRDSVLVSELKRDAMILQASIKKIREETLDRICSEGYFDAAAHARSKKLLQFHGSATALLFFLFIVFFFLARSGSSVIAFLFPIVFVATIVLAILTTRIAARFGHTLTPKGIDTLAKILGFKLFLEVTEKDRLAMTNAPAMEPALFEKCLPYAMVLGVEKQWAKRFEGICTAMPGWYDGDLEQGFSAPLFVSQLMIFNTAVNGSFGVYGGSGNFSSGFGGGGFSGGGSGGGGGGSW